MLSLYITLYFHKTLYLSSLESLVFSPPHIYRTTLPHPGGTKAQTSSHCNQFGFNSLRFHGCSSSVLAGFPGNAHNLLFVASDVMQELCLEGAFGPFILPGSRSKPSPQSRIAFEWGLVIFGLKRLHSSYIPSFKRHPYTNMFSTHLLHIKYCWQKRSTFFW